MMYRKHSEYMTQEEVEALMKALLPESRVKNIDRLKDSNCINVNFELQGKEGMLVFYSDDVDNVPEWAPLENAAFYQIYMIASGYSLIWAEKPYLKFGEWAMKARNNMEERRGKQQESDSILQELLRKSEEALDTLQEMAEEGPLKDELKLYRQINGQVMERQEHISYVRGVSDAVSMMHIMDNRVSLAELATELEESLAGYQNLHGLIETFGDGAKAQLGNFDVVKGIFAIADALDKENEVLNNLFEKITG